MGKVLGTIGVILGIIASIILIYQFTTGNLTLPSALGNPQPTVTSSVITPIPSVTPTHPGVPGDISGTHEVVNRQNNLCLQLNNNASANGTFVAQWECDQGSTKQWSFIDQGNGQYEIVEKSSGKCLQLNNNSNNNGTQAVLWQCDQGSMKLWILSAQGNGSYEIVNASSNKCLQIDNNDTANGAYIVLWQCDQGTEKFWTLL